MVWNLELWALTTLLENQITSIKEEKDIALCDYKQSMTPMNATCNVVNYKIDIVVDFKTSLKFEH